MRGFFFIKNPTKDSKDPLYLLYDVDFIVLCNHTSCVEKKRLGLPLKARSMKVINSNTSKIFAMQLKNDSKSLRFLDLGNMETNRIEEKM